METEEMPFTGKHLESVTAFIDKARKGQFLGMGDKLIILGDLISLKAECAILEAVALAADKVENPPTELLFALNRLHRRGQVTCPGCELTGTPFPGEDPVKCGNCSHEFTREEGGAR